MSVRSTRCLVEMDRERCAGCRQRCSAGLSFLGEIELDLPDVRRVPRTPSERVPRALPGLMPGEQVLVGVSRSGLGRAAGVVFALPLAAMLAVGALSYALWGAALVGAIGGLGGGAVTALIIGRRGVLDRWVRPSIVGHVNETVRAVS